MRRLAVILLWLVLSLPARAEEVDLELLLLVDVSYSMSERELEIQRRGYATALRSDAVFAAIRGGMLGRIAMSYVEWSNDQEVVVDWRLLETRADLDAFANALTAEFRQELRRTGISGALLSGARMLEENRFDGLRRVIDISGDGPNNLGPPVNRARDTVLAKGITINGLPLLTKDGFGTDWNLDRLDIYYRTCVTGGPGSFVIPVHGWGDFPRAVRRKLVLEIAGRAPLVHRAQAIARDPTDCLIGEKIWEQRRLYWNEP